MRKSFTLLLLTISLSIQARAIRPVLAYMTMLWLLLLGNGILSAQNPLITTWNTNNISLGSSTAKTIIIPTTGTGYNYDVDWNNDGAYDELGLTGNVAHTYATAGTYTIRIRGAFPRIYFNNTGDRFKLLSITQWGDIAWTSMEAAFDGCRNLAITATDVPNLSGVTSMARMFRTCAALNGPANIGTWNTATVTDMSALFEGDFAFNQNIGAWNTAAVTNMSRMFYGTPFNQNIGAWSTAAVTDMSAMFQSATSFNQNIGAWSTAAVTNMSNMFTSAAAFNQNIGSWNTAAVTNMAGMFQSANTFNQNIGNWTTAAVTNMSLMFYNALAFNQNISAWNTASVTNMRGMFSRTNAFNQPIGNWNTSAVTDMFGMFQNAIAFNQPIGNWNTAAVTNMGTMFYGASVFNKDISNWNTAAVTNMYYMFAITGAFNQPIGNWNTAAVTDMSNMFSSANAFNKPIGNWNTAAVTNMSTMFYDATVFNQDISGWNTAAVTNMYNMFASASAFNQPIGNWNTAAVTNMAGMFNFTSVFNKPIGSWNTAAVTDMSSMFNGALAFNQPLDNWNTAAVTNMSYMFNSASAFNQPLGNWTLAQYVSLGGMLNYCGMNCANYSTTLIGWADNPNTPTELYLDAYDRQYGLNAETARMSLTNDIGSGGKGWFISGDAASGTNCSLVLPVELLSFQAHTRGKQILLDWRTATEINNLGWDIERSPDGRQWKTIGFCAGHGNVSDVQVYTFTDEKPLPGHNYFRLKQWDNNRQYKYSDVVQVVMSGSGNQIGAFYPNPTRAGLVSLEFHAEKEGELIVSVFDATGRLVLRRTQALEEDRNVLQFDFSQLTAGLYSVHLNDGTSPVVRNLTIE